MTDTSHLPVPSDLIKFLGLKEQSLVITVRDGLPFEAYERLRAILGVNARGLAEVVSISERTLRRRRQAGRLTSEESARILRAAHLVQLALVVFEGNSEFAVRWLTEPKMLLGGESPLARADTEPGAREVEHILYSIEFSLPV